MTDTPDLFDFDNHYYESEDAFTRHLDPRLGSRCVRWVEMNGRRRILVGGRLNSYVANPTFDPVARPGSLYDWYRGNPEQKTIVEAFGELEPIRAEYRIRSARLAVMEEQGLSRILLFPTLGVGLEDALRDDPEAAVHTFQAFNRWLEEDWGYSDDGRIFGVPYVQMLDPVEAARELERVLDRGATVVNVRNAPVPVPGGYRSPFDPVYDGFWGLAAESNTLVATHAGNDGYDALVQMWEPGGSESSLFRSPLRGVVTKGRAVSDFYAAAVCHKVFDRFPELRMASVENGASWIPDLLHRLRDAANRSPGNFTEDPCETFGEHVWVTPFWEDNVPDLVDQYRVDRLLMGSDWPHAEGTRQPSDFVTETLAGLSPPDVRRIARDNALDLLGLPSA
jgi:predicted TIM-barrel fold metal-dependent hydrolase